MANEASEGSKTTRNLCHPFESQFARLTQLGLTINRKGYRPVKEMRFAPGLFDVDIIHGSGAMSEYIHITKPIAEALAQLVSDPRVGYIDIPYVSSIDDDAKPVLEAAIRDYKGLGIAIGHRTILHTDDNRQVLNWYSQTLLKIQNPNLIGAAVDDGSLSSMIAENQKYADSIIETIQNPKKIDRDVCLMAAERMPLILYTLNQRYRGADDWQKYDVGLGLLQLQTVAKADGIKIDFPEEFKWPAKTVAENGEIARRSWTTLPTIRRLEGEEFEEPASVVKDRDEDGYLNRNWNPFLSKQLEEDSCWSDMLRNANKTQQYPPKNSR